MTDNEIIKALECCSVHPMKCKKCPYEGNECCTNAHRKDALDLINRQKAEIERLKGYNENLQTANVALSNEILDIKAEAIKEFAERLAEKYACLYGYRDGLLEGEIDDLVKEMENKP